MHRAALRGVDRVWRDLRFRDLYRSGKIELMQQALGFAALAALKVTPLLILVAATGRAPHHGPGRVGGLRHGSDRFL